LLFWIRLPHPRRARTLASPQTTSTPHTSPPLHCTALQCTRPLFNHTSHLIPRLLLRPSNPPPTAHSLVVHRLFVVHSLVGSVSVCL
jgi:hypothetical protein